MSYIDGFVIPVEDARRDEFIDHAERVDRIFIELGARTVFEAWGDDVPEGKRTDFHRAVDRQEGESVVFSWIVWPDKATRDAAFKRMETDERMMAEPMPFDGKRMIFGGFAPLFEEGQGGGSYVDGFILAVPADKQEPYRAMAAKAWPIFAEHGARHHLEAWEDDVPDGTVTDYRRAVQAGEGERIVFSFIRWPDKATRDAAWPKLMADERMKPEGEMPFDGQRMFWGGFDRIVELTA